MVNTRCRRLLLTTCLTVLSLQACNLQPSDTSLETRPQNPECLAPAKPGGGFDITCRLAASALQSTQIIDQPIRVEYMPGGVGAVAYNHVIGSRRDDANLIVAVSSGSALNLAQGKFGQYDETAVRWLAAIGADYGAIVVSADAPWQNLDELMQSVKEDPGGVVFGAGGSIGSQDWMKMALLAQSAGVDPQQMRFVAFEGGGEAITALLGGVSQVCSCDLSEISGQLESGSFRILAVLADERLPDGFADYPTAKEQGYDVTWTGWRGYYAPPEISDQQYDWWVNTMQQLVETPEFEQARAERGLFPFTKIGQDYQTYVQEQVTDFRELAQEMGLIQ